MASEINTQVELKRIAHAKSQEKIDMAQHAIDNKLRVLDRLKTVHAKKAEDLERMEALAKEHNVLEERSNWIKARMSQMFHGHDSTTGKLQDDPEYRTLRDEQDALAPKLETTLPKLKKIFYGKG